MEIQIVPLRESQLDAAIGLIGRAFYNAPSFTHIIPQGVRNRVRKIECCAAFGVRYGCTYNRAYTTADEIKGVAVWIPQEQFSFDLSRMWQAGLFILPFQIGVRAFWRQMTLLNKIEQIHKRNMPERHWYLELLGVEPSHQGQGIGSALMHPILQQADLEGIPCYLETFSEKNVYFYRQHGFQVLKTIDMPEVNLHLWTMKREPQ
ncbi:GNAT family N-acetyltransferase [Chroococcidiopsis sp. CCALA 051]|uniref:GNAT family N-acetyltransferase n=1 Tax=Chroococcidiopsis sp. CCALA 051 TaxID=869949 RepID=UPI000D0CB253|nr:GNAT family N-acetyltransferase [Chroococcidiopsis sp. CCALA 051]MBE9017047.1 GNAT family N-acetyltransferase [Chroococcidiopsidales cyanobacterium LEGE 13417]PSM46361.1 GNAT family N-acetyltransferase [Chroococcidiopsis sp. CCALA 051]